MYKNSPSQENSGKFVTFLERGVRLPPEVTPRNNAGSNVYMICVSLPERFKRMISLNVLLDSMPKSRQTRAQAPSNSDRAAPSRPNRPDANIDDAAVFSMRARVDNPDRSGGRERVEGHSLSSEPRTLQSLRELSEPGWDEVRWRGRGHSP